MMITIKPLTPDLTSSYLDFFDNRAFSDGNPNGPCYCTAPSMDTASARKMVSEFGSDVKGTLRRYAVELLAEGKIHGYLAFDGDIPVGWCNAGDLTGYANVGFEDDFSGFIQDHACGKTMSAVCFAIAPDYRGKGIAAALLERIISDAKKEGFAAVEGYAAVLKERTYTDFNGPLYLYAKMGFCEAARRGDKVIMRKMLVSKQNA